MIVVLKATDGPLKGQEFRFDSHDTFLFGRGLDCHARLPESDPSASRNHFLIEVCPPLIRLRDLGSTNGTYVNEKRYGGRNATGPNSVELKDGDQIRVGKHTFALSIEGNVPGVTRFVYDGEEAHAATEIASLQAPYTAGKNSIGGYVLEKQLGAGGMGAVYLVRESSGRRAALKLMHSEQAKNETLKNMFLRESAAQAAVRHPNIVEVYDSGVEGTTFYFVMELCEWGSIADILERSNAPLDLTTANRFMLQILEGLAHAHSLGFVHRDLKPENVLIHPSDNGTAKLTDFGLAKNFQMAGLSGLTVAGAFAGTVDYMPKEQVVNYKWVKPNSDVWSIAATYYNMVTNTTPRIFPNGLDPIQGVLSVPATPIRDRNPRVPVPIASVIDRALLMDANSRYSNAQELQGAFAEAWSSSASALQAIE